MSHGRVRQFTWTHDGQKCRAWSFTVTIDGKRSRRQGYGSRADERKSRPEGRTLTAWRRYVGKNTWDGRQ
jgi:hypothetical protein